MESKEPLQSFISVPKKYEAAMETALRRVHAAYLVGTEQDGRKAIAYLKQNQYGRATFCR